MKKKTIFISSIIGILFIGIICLKFIPFGTKEYRIPNSNITIEIPKMSILDKDYGSFSATFKSFSNEIVLQYELDKIIEDYEEKTCNNKTVYYNKNKNITITDYGVNQKFLFNTFYITYDKSEFDINDCSAVTDPTKLIYSIKESHRAVDDCYGPIKYKNKDGNIYNLHYDWCFGDLLFQTGTGKMNYLYAMLGYGWISMSDVIDFLDFQTKNEEATKEVFKDGGSIMYKNKDFSLLKCNTLDGNQDIYIGNIDMKYETDYCK